MGRLSLPLEKASETAAGHHLRDLPGQRDHPTCVTGVPPNSTVNMIAVCQTNDSIIALKKEGFPIIDGMQTFESAGHWFVIRVKNNWHELTGGNLDEFMNKLGNFCWNNHIGGGFAKVIIVGEDIDPDDPLAVTFAFATRNHPEKGAWYFPKAKFYGLGPEGWHSSEDYFGRFGAPGQKIVSGAGLVIYSCIGLEEHVGHPEPDILTFHRSYPKAIKEKVLANWDAGVSARPTRSCKSKPRLVFRGSTSTRPAKEKPDGVTISKLDEAIGGDLLQTYRCTSRTDRGESDATRLCPDREERQKP